MSAWATCGKIPFSNNEMKNRNPVTSYPFTPPSDQKEIYPYNFDTYLNVRIVFDFAPNSQSQNYWQCMENSAEKVIF